MRRLATFTHQKRDWMSLGVRESGLIGSLTPTELVFQPSKGNYDQQKHARGLDTALSFVYDVKDLKGRINGSFLKTVPSKISPRHSHETYKVWWTQTKRKCINQSEGRTGVVHQLDFSWCWGEARRLPAVKR